MRRSGEVEQEKAKGGFREQKRPIMTNQLVVAVLIGELEQRQSLADGLAQAGLQVVVLQNSDFLHRLLNKLPAETLVIKPDQHAFLSEPEFLERL
jgi:hypothetical protein